MAKGISINFLADVRDFLKGTKNVEDGLDDVADSLDDVAKEGDQATEKLEDGFRELAKAAKKSGDDVGDGMKQGFKKAEGGLDDFKQEANSTAKESAASFDGSAESIVDSFQEIAANAFEGFGPAGAVAGLAVAAGIGIATSEFQKTQEEAQAAKDRINEFGLAIIENGAEVASLEQYQDALKGIVTNADDATAKIEDLEKFTKKYGDRVPGIEDMAMAYAGNADAVESVTTQLESAIKAEEELQKTTKGGKGEAILASENRAKAYQDQIDQIKQVQEETALAQEIEQRYLATGGAETIAKADAISQINDAYDDAVYSVENFKNAETGIYDLEAYAASIREREALLMEYQSNLAESGLTTDQKAALNEMGVEQANAILKGLKDPSTSAETKETIKKGLKTASQEGSGVAQEEIKKAFKTPIEAKIEAKLDQESANEANRAIERAIRDRNVRVTVEAYDRNGRRVY